MIVSDFVNYYNYRRHHKALENVTPANVLYGQPRLAVQSPSLQSRRKIMGQEYWYNMALDTHSPEQSKVRLPEEEAARTDN